MLRTKRTSWRLPSIRTDPIYGSIVGPIIAFTAIFTATNGGSARLAAPSTT
eukprot:XP_001705641.1 Hypothetical protein GL50803_25776 [Giardia lamblia ATCC 50803]